MRALEELKAALGGDELLGPAPILRLRGRHRAQLVAKTDRPGALAARAGARSRRSRAGDAEGRPQRRRRRRSAVPLSYTAARSDTHERGRAEEHGQVSDEQLDAEREARRRLALAQIRQWPDPVLKMRAGRWRTSTTTSGGSSSGWRR